MGKPWFRVKRVGFGAGLPCSWQGWAVIGAYGLILLLVVGLGSPHIDQHPLLYLAAIGLPTAIAVFIAWRKSDGPWRWRSGDE